MAFSLILLFFEGDVNTPTCNKSIIGGIRKTSIEDFTKCMNTTPRASKYFEEYPKPIKLKKLNILN